MQQRSEETRTRLRDSAIKLFSTRGFNKASIAPYGRYPKHFTSLIKKGVDEGSFVEVDPELASRTIVSTAMGLFLQSLLEPKRAQWGKLRMIAQTLWCTVC